MIHIYMSYKSKYLKYKSKYTKLQHGGYNITNIDDGILYGNIMPDEDDTLQNFMEKCGINGISSYEYIYINIYENKITDEILNKKVSTLNGYESNETNDMLFIDNTFTRIMRGHQNGGIFFKGNKILKISDGEQLEKKLNDVPKEILDMYPKKYELKKSFIYMEKFDYDLTDYFFTYLPMELIKTKFENNEFLINAWNDSNKLITEWKPSIVPIYPTDSESRLLMDFIHSLIDIYRTFAYKFWFEILIFLKTMRKYDYTNMDLKWDNLAIDSEHKLRFIDEDSGLINYYDSSNRIIEIESYMKTFTDATVFDTLNLGNFPIFKKYKLKQYKIGDLVNLVPQSLEGLENYEIIKIDNPQALSTNTSNGSIKHIEWQNYWGSKLVFTIFLNRSTIEIQHKSFRSLGIKGGGANKHHDLNIINPLIQEIYKSAEITNYSHTNHHLKLTDWKHRFGETDQEILWIGEPNPYGNTVINNIEGDIATMFNGGKFKLPELSGGGYHINLEWPSNELKIV